METGNHQRPFWSDGRAVDGGGKHVGDKDKQIPLLLLPHVVIECRSLDHFREKGALLLGGDGQLVDEPPVDGIKRRFVAGLHGETAHGYALNQLHTGAMVVVAPIAVEVVGAGGEDFNGDPGGVEMNGRLPRLRLRPPRHIFPIPRGYKSNGVHELGG